MAGEFTAFHRGGSGSPLVCLHGFSDTWRTWEPVLPALERRHDVLAVALAGHAGGPELAEPVAEFALVEAVERVMDEAGLQSAHVLGNSLGGYVALQLAARGRALSVVGLAPSGGWREGDEALLDTLEHHRRTQDLVRASAPHADRIAAGTEGRRQATQAITVSYEHLPPDLVAHLIRGAANAAGAAAILQRVAEHGYPLEAAAITCPLRIVWGTEDRLLPFPRAAVRWRELLPHADWVELEAVGHCPQLDVPAVVAELVLEWTARWEGPDQAGV